MTLTFDLVTSTFIGVVYWPWPIFLPSRTTVTHELLKNWADIVFALIATVTLTFDLVTSRSVGVIYWPWLIFLPTFTHKIFKILSGLGFFIKCYCDPDLWHSDLKFIGIIYWPWPIFLPSTMTVTQKLFNILSGHDVAYGRTDGRTDGQTDGPDGRTNGRHTIIRPKFHFGRTKKEGRKWEP